MEIVGHGAILVVIRSRKVKDTWRGFVCELSEAYRAIDDWIVRHGTLPYSVSIENSEH